MDCADWRGGVPNDIVCDRHNVAIMKSKTFLLI